jgi:hypothetical protein
MKALMDVGAKFSVHHGCPMLRVHDVPDGPDAQQWLDQLSCEFGSMSMSGVVRDALEACSTGAHTSQHADSIAIAEREWDDSPLCAMVVRTAESSEGKLSAEMPFGFQPVTPEQCSFDCGKRLNRNVAAMLQHFGLGPDCLSLSEEAAIELTKLHGYTERYRDLFSRATIWFDETDDSFRARERGLFVFCFFCKDIATSVV